MRHTRRLAASGAILLAVALAGCSASDTEAAPSPSSTSSTESTVTAAPSDDSVTPAPEESSDALRLVPPTAYQIVDYFQSSGLVVENVRDNTDKGWCEPDMWDCVEFLTSEQVSIVIQPSAAGADRMRDSPGVYVSSDGRVALSFAAQRTPVEQQTQYTQMLEDYLLQLAAQG